MPRVTERRTGLDDLMGAAEIADQRACYVTVLTELIRKPPSTGQAVTFAGAVELIEGWMRAEPELLSGYRAWLVARCSTRYRSVSWPQLSWAEAASLWLRGRTALGAQPAAHDRRDGILLYRSLHRFLEQPPLRK